MPEEERRRDEEQLRFLEEAAIAVTAQGAGATDAAIKEMDETVKLAMIIACMMRHSKSLTKIAAEVSVKAKEKFKAGNRSGVGPAISEGRRLLQA